MIRRSLAIPHPTAFYRTAKLIADHWKMISEHCAASKLSLGAPIDDGTFRAIKMRDGFDARPLRRAVDRAGARFLLRADLAEFYPTLYTHTIPWALHGKPTAKGNKGRITANPKGLLGNDLDYHCRRANSNHTKGLAIGPDTSYVIAESVLSACDCELAAKLPEVRGFRIYDDYELCCDTFEAAENALATLQGVLALYELGLNPRKTEIRQLPDRLGDDFVTFLNRFSFATEPASQAEALVAYFDSVFSYAALHPQEHVVTYAAGRFKREAIAPANWEMLTGLLLQAAQFEPSALQNVAEILDAGFCKGLPVAKPLVCRAANAIICQHARCGHSSEVAWALWLLLRFRLTVEADAVTALASMEDPVVALLTLEAESKDILSATLDKSQWQARMTTQDLREEHWLLAYEAVQKGWLAGAGGTDHVAADVEFDWLRRQQVSFYEPVEEAKMKKPAPKKATVWHAPTTLVGTGAEELSKSNGEDQPPATSEPEDVGADEFAAKSAFWFYF